MPMFQPRIAIVGGGPSGLALALLLSRRGIHATVYELRDKPTPEELSKPSGMLDLHEESGLAVIHECGLWDTFQSAVGDCSEAARVLSPQGTVLHTDEGEFATRPEIARNSLTSLLSQNIPENAIRWNHKIVSIRSAVNSTTGATEITLDLGPIGTAIYDFVIGADGAWSRTRKFLSDIQPFYAGSQFLTATLRRVSKNHPHLRELNGTGTLAALGGGNGILTHRGPQDSIRVYAAVSTPHANWAEVVGLKGKSATEAKKILLGDDKLFRKWAPELQDLLATACDEEEKDNPECAADILPLYMLPIGHCWEHHPGVTLAGDAAHLMTPWAGEGVNLALWDSLDLAHILAAVPEATEAAAWQAAVDPRVKEFENKMIARAQEKSKETVRMRDLLLSENGAQAMVDMFREAMAGVPPKEK